MKPIALFAAVSLLALPVVAQEAAPPPDTDVAQILADRIDRDQANVGMAVALVADGEARFVSHGQWGREDDRPVDEHTLFEAGSISKVFTNLLLAQLVNDGKIDLDAPLVTYLPEGTVLPQWEGREITAFDLATHSAALPSLPADMAEQPGENPYSAYGADRLMDWLAEYELTSPIGEKFSYSNAGTALLAQAIEHVSGEDYATLLQTQILDPLEMTETRLALSGSEAPDMASGHDAGGEAVPHWDFDAFAPVGGLLTTSSDLAKFAAAATNQVETPLAPAFETMLARTRPADGDDAIGLGWFITPTGSGEIVWHNGITAGFRSFIGFERDSGRAVVVLSNMVTEAGIEDIGMHLIDPAMPLNEQPEARDVAEIDPAILPGYAGDYLLAPGVVMTVTTEDDRLFAEITGQQRFELFPESETDFFYRVVDAQVHFDVVDGETRSLTLFQNGEQMPALKVK